MVELVKRAERDDSLALLILGGTIDLLDETMVGEDDKGLLALANSIKTNGLRQPINVYSIVNPKVPGEPFYQVGEGERRYWAHHLLVLQDEDEFAKIRCVVEPIPDDDVLNLPPDLQDLAEAAQLPEKQLRPITALPEEQ